MWLAMRLASSRGQPLRGFSIALIGMTVNIGDACAFVSTYGFDGYAFPVYMLARKGLHAVLPCGLATVRRAKDELKLKSVKDGCTDGWRWKR